MRPDGKVIATAGWSDVPSGELREVSRGSKVQLIWKPSVAVRAETAEKTLPYALDKQIVFFGALTGAPLLRRDPPDRFVFNIRRSSKSYASS
jgi:hypothetical protein